MLKWSDTYEELDSRENPEPMRSCYVTDEYNETRMQRFIKWITPKYGKWCLRQVDPSTQIMSNRREFPIVKERNKPLPRRVNAAMWETEYHNGTKDISEYKDGR